MKRFVIVGAVVATLLILLLFVRPRGSSTPETLVPTPQTHAPANPPRSMDAKAPQSESNAEDAGSSALATNQVNEFEQLVRRSTETANLPVAFYGLVVDQDSNVLQNVSVDLAVVEERVDSFPQHNQKITTLQRQTDAEGRFEVRESGLKGRMIGVSMLTKAGYEQEFPGQGCGMFGTQSTSFENPAVLKMWSTSIPHEQLITGDVSSAVIPDGRRYGIDLTNRAVIEGAEGDLTVWLKRPTTVGWEKYDWSCELTANGGLLEETGGQPMLIAPATGYTNVFTYRQEAVFNDWTHGLYGKRFYLRLRSGQIYGRITVNLTTSPNRKAPATLRVQYVVNPSGSRLLR